jgi:hypothetical protein
MNHLGMQARRLSIIVMSILLSTLVYMTLQSCKKEPTVTSETNCTNGLDDDGDGTIDCDDFDCGFSHPEICNQPDGDLDSDQDTDQPTDGDTDHDDGGADGDTDTDIDFDLDPDVDGPCNPDGNVCDWSCERHTDCALVFDTLNCCGGFPHRIDGEMVACVTATHRDRLGVDHCVLPWHPGDPIPTVPAGCAPFCEGASCPACPETDAAMRAVCHDGECRALCSNCCLTDDDCPEGARCVDPTHEGTSRCVTGEDACTTDEECLAMEEFSTCTGCICGDANSDGLRDCACFGCGGDVEVPCLNDRACGPHEFCIDGDCVFQGEDHCVEGTEDCSPCGFCEHDPESPPGTMRGHCVALDWGDVGPPADSDCE